MPLNIVCFEASKLVSTKTQVLKHYYCCQGKFLFYNDYLQAWKNLTQKTLWALRMVLIFFCSGEGKGSPKCQEGGSRLFIDHPRTGCGLGARRMFAFNFGGRRRRGLVSHYSVIGDTRSCHAPYSAIGFRGKLFLRYPPVRSVFGPR